MCLSLTLSFRRQYFPLHWSAQWSPSSPEPASPNADTSMLWERGDLKWWLCRFLPRTSIITEHVNILASFFFWGGGGLSYKRDVSTRYTGTQYQQPTNNPSEKETSLSFSVISSWRQRSFALHEGEYEIFL